MAPTAAHTRPELTRTEAAAQRQRLAALVHRASQVRGLRGLSEEELLEFGRLYRRAVSQLSHARTHGVDAGELEQLNWLVGRAYGLLYMTETAGLASIGRFFAGDLPQTFRRHWRLVVVSMALFLVPALLAGLLTVRRPDVLEILSPDTAATLQSITQRHEGNPDWLPAEFRPIASSTIMTHNIQITFLAFAGGMLLGLPTLYELIFNGLVLGAVGAGVGHTSAGLYFWAFVAPHGMVEIPSIWISAAAGLLLALAIIEPGPYSRADALRVAGREAAVLMFGVVVFLIFAGVVEGFFSPAVLPLPLKFGVAGLIGATFWSYLLLAGRGTPATAATWPSPGGTG